MINKLCYKCSDEIGHHEETKHGLHLDCFMEWFNVKTKDTDFESLALLKSTNDTQQKEKGSYATNSFFQKTFLLELILSG